MGGVCTRRRASWTEELGIASEYDWEGLDQDRIDEYYNAKDACEAEIEKESPGQILDPNWIERVPPQSKEMLKGLLLRRAVALVHVLKPIEEQRHGIRKMQNKGYLPENHFASFERAEEMCNRELKSLMEESQVIAPGIAPNEIIQSAVQIYHQQGMPRPQAADAEADSGKGFEDVKRGFLKNASTKKEPPSAHGFEIGIEVEAHSLQTDSMNGARGKVLKAKGERVAVSFPEPLGEKALKPANLRLVPPPPQIHPDATDAPVTQFQVLFARARGEPLGIALQHEPPLEAQRPDQESHLLVTNIEQTGFARKFNEQQKDPEMKLRRGDRILAVVDGSVPEQQRRPVGGNSKAILDVIQTGKTPLMFIVGRMLGPPLRFKIGQQVKANCGQRGWMEGSCIKVWEERCDGSAVPYVIRIKESGDTVFAPNDSDDCVVKGEARFKVGEKAFANHEGNYKKCKIEEVRDEGIRIAYKVKLVGDGQETLEVSEDLNRFIRPISRFEKGTKVVANVAQKFVPGIIEACYHPNWVYAVRLEAGNVVFCPEDTDIFVKKR